MIHEEGLRRLTNGACRSVDRRGDFVTHDEAIGILRRGAPPRRQGAAWDAAGAHVAGCSECWTVIASTYKAATGRLPSSADRMEALLGCEATRRELHFIAQLRPEEMVARYPGPARHLGRCAACRDLFADLLVAEDGLRTGDVDPFDVVPEPMTWRLSVTALGERLVELAGTAVVRVRDEVAAFSHVPDGMTLVPALAGAMRGTTGSAAGQRATVPIGDTGLVATLTLDAHGDGRARLGLSVSGAPARDLAAELRDARDGRFVLLGGQKLSASSEVAFREVPPGLYALDVRESVPPRRHRLTVRIDGS